MKRKNKGLLFVAVLAVFAVAITAIRFQIPASRKQAEAYAAAAEEYIKDGSFEEMTPTDKGDWVFYTTSTQGAGGTVELIANDSETTVAAEGDQAIKMTASSSQWPEIYQLMTVEKNTDYYITFDFMNLDTALVKKTNVFYGFANTNPAANVDIHQQQRWLDKSTRNFAEGADAHFTPMNAKLNTGNNTSVRFFLRTNNSEIVIDNFKMQKAASILPAGSENLLERPGFEGSDAQLARAWNTFGTGNVAEGQVKSGFDDYRKDADYKDSVKIQNKEVEGYVCLWLAYFNGAAAGDTYGVYQDVTVSANKTYAFYANLSKFKQLGGAEIGVYGYNDEETGTDKMTKKLVSLNVNDKDLYCSSYTLFNVIVNSGENTKLRPYVIMKAGTDFSWSWGAGLLVDDLYFFDTATTVPADATNLFEDPMFSKTANTGENKTPWKYTGSWGGEFGLNAAKATEYLGFNSVNNAWISDWAQSSMYQTLSLQAGKTYKVTARVNAYMTGNGNFTDGLNPFGITVEDENDVVKQMGFAVARKYRNYNAGNLNAYVQNTAWTPIELIFTAETSGEFTIYFGFIKSASWWCGGVNLSAPAIYEYVAPIDPPELASTNTAVTISGTGITVTSAMTAQALKGAFTINEPYTLSIVSAANAALANTDNVITGCKVLVLNGTDTAATYTVTVNIAAEPDPDNDGDGDGNGDTNKGCFGGVSAELPIALSVLLLAVLIKRRR